jgi:hypothetical protein
MSELEPNSPDLEALFQRERERETELPADIARVRVASAVARAERLTPMLSSRGTKSAEAPSRAGPTATTSPVAPNPAVSLATKLAWAIAGVAIGVGGTLAVTRATATNPSAPVLVSTTSLTSAAPATPALTLIPAPTLSTTLPDMPPTTATSVEAKPAMTGGGASSVAAAERVPGTASSPASSEQSNLTLERELIDAARSALSHANYTESLSLLRKHETQFPRGLLNEERMGLTILALLRKGDTEQAKAKWQTFQRIYPKSHLGKAIERELP